MFSILLGESCWTEKACPMYMYVLLHVCITGLPSDGDESSLSGYGLVLETSSGDDDTHAEVDSVEQAGIQFEKEEEVLLYMYKVLKTCFSVSL